MIVDPRASAGVASNVTAATLAAATLVGAGCQAGRAYPVATPRRSGETRAAVRVARLGRTAGRSDLLGGRMDIAEFRAQVPITRSRAYLFSGALAPAATPVRAA